MFELLFKPIITYYSCFGIVFTAYAQIVVQNNHYILFLSTIVQIIVLKNHYVVVEDVYAV